MKKGKHELHGKLNNHYLKTVNHLMNINIKKQINKHTLCKHANLSCRCDGINCSRPNVCMISGALFTFICCSSNSVAFLDPAGITPGINEGKCHSWNASWAQMLLISGSCYSMSIPKKYCTIWFNYIFISLDLSTRCPGSKVSHATTSQSVLCHVHTGKWSAMSSGVMFTHFNLS